MALHGTIEVNGNAIGHWSARRTVPLVDVDQVSDYECAVTLRREGRDDLFRFKVRHRYSHGAMRLAVSVLSHADVLRHTTRPGSGD